MPFTYRSMASSAGAMPIPRARSSTSAHRPVGVHVRPAGDQPVRPGGVYGEQGVRDVGCVLPLGVPLRVLGRCDGGAHWALLSGAAMLFRGRSIPAVSPLPHSGTPERAYPAAVGIDLPFSPGARYPDGGPFDQGGSGLRLLL
ncbi:MAG: hypothetical protein H0W52_12520 [Rubrobacteraceae bacterium]|nr:hypothetical protein [Rubrobacteraceae bacterium]